MGWGSGVRAEEGEQTEGEKKHFKQVSVRKKKKKKFHAGALPAAPADILTPGVWPMFWPGRN